MIVEIGNATVVRLYPYDGTLSCATILVVGMVSCNYVGLEELAVSVNSKPTLITAAPRDPVLLGSCQR